MAEPKVPPRPRQVTTAAVLGLASCVLLVLSLFDTMERIRSIEMREAIEQFLAKPPGSTLGLTADGVGEFLHGLVLLDGALAALAAVLAVFVLQRHRVARIGFSVAAGLLLLTSAFTGGVTAVLVALAATLMWGKPARDWFAGREPETAPAAPTSHAFEQQMPPRPPGGSSAWAPPTPPAVPPVAPTGSDPSDPSDASSPSGEEAAARPGPASYPFGQRPDDLHRVVEPARPGEAGPAYPPPSPQSTAATPGSVRRPASVIAAAVLTWLSSALLGLVFLVIVVMLVANPDALLGAIADSPDLARADLAPRDLLAALWVISAVCLVWCLAAMTLAVLALRRLNVARVLLTASALVSGLAAAFGGVAGLLLTAVALVTVVLLFTPASNRWYAGAAQSPAGPTSPQAPPAAGSQQPGQDQPPQRRQVW